jgi:hypothetical protein
VPKSPNFEKRASKILDREYLNDGDKKPTEDKYTTMMKKLASTAKATPDDKKANPSSTKAMALS